jgi:hypothetical protein
MLKVDFANFMSNTMGGWPPKANMSVYEGMKFECACGEWHEFYQHNCAVLRELKGMTFVISYQNCEYVNAVKVKGLFKPKLETQFGTNQEE